MRHCRATSLILAFVIAALPARSADADRIADIRAMAATVEGIFEEHATENRLPGLAWGVVAGSELVLSGSFGYGNLDEQIPADTRTLFRIASMTKSFTAVAILQLRDAGKIELDEPAETYLPELATLASLTTDAPRITVRNLLTHSAGFPEDNPWGDRQLADSDEALLSLVENGISLSTAPGIGYEYSNLGFALLGQIVQRVSGMPFTEYMATHVFEPLGMDDTAWDYEEVPPEQLALGYGWRDGGWFDEPYLHHGSFGAMGGLISSVQDFSRYAALHLAAWPPRDGADDGILSRSSLREMHHPWNFSGLDAGHIDSEGRACPRVSAYGYGLGWRSDCRGRVYVRHSGGLPGFGSNWTMMPDFDIAVVSFDNRTYASTDGVNVRVLETIIAGAGLEPRMPDVSDILADRQAALLRILPGFEEAEAAGIFAENFFLDTPLSVRQDETMALFDRAGDILAVGPLVPENRLRGTFVIDGETGDLEVFFTLTPEKEPMIQQLRIVLLPD